MVWDMIWFKEQNCAHLVEYEEGETLELHLENIFSHQV